jgi:hypothetical protein
MTSIAKYACSFLVAVGLALPALAAEGDAKPAPGQPDKSVAVNPDKPSQKGQSEGNAKPSAVNPGSPVQKGETATAPNSK